MTACAAIASRAPGSRCRTRNAGSLLLFDVNNIRYVTATKIGEWERDKMCRFCLLTGDDSPYVWDFGSAAVHHKRHSDWLEPDHCLAGVVGMRGTIPPEFGLMQKYAKMIAQMIKDAGMADMPVGVDYAETAMFHALKDAGASMSSMASRSCWRRARSRTGTKSSC